MGHLIAIETDQHWLVNNRIDKQTWNVIHDGNWEYFYFVLLHMILYITEWLNNVHNDLIDVLRRAMPYTENKLL